MYNQPSILGQVLGSGVIIGIVILVLLLAILWTILPFAVFGVKQRLDTIISKVQKIEEAVTGELERQRAERDFRDV